MLIQSLLIHEGLVTRLAPANSRMSRRVTSMLIQGLSIHESLVARPTFEAGTLSMRVPGMLFDSRLARERPGADLACVDDLVCRRISFVLVKGWPGRELLAAIALERHDQGGGEILYERLDREEHKKY